MTVRDLVTTALLKLGVLAEGETASASMAAGGVRVLNSMIDSWATESLLVYVIDRQSFALVAGTQTYTLGPGGVWNTTPLYGAGTPRPIQLEAVWWQDPSDTTIEYPVTVVRSHEDYQALRAQLVTSAMVTAAYYDPTFPLGTVFVYPRPTAVANLLLYLWHPWNAATTLDTVVSFPPGYQRALEFNLAVDLSTEYAGSLRPEVAAIAVEAKDKIRALNVRLPRMVSDLWGVTRGGGSGSLYGFNDFLTGRV